MQKSGNGPPPWAVVVRKTLIEEGHSTPQLLIIFELIVSHSDLFYESRDLFVPQMVNALPRLGSAPAATSEMKKVGRCGSVYVRWCVADEVILRPSAAEH